VLGAAVAPVAAHTAPAHSPASAPPEAGIDQRLGESVPLDLPFRNEAGQTVTLGSAMQGKATIVVLLYYKCTMLCPLLLDGLVRGLQPIGFEVGREFSVVTVSINPRETPLLAAMKKKETLARYPGRRAGEGWSFLTGDQPAIDALTKAVGFRYTHDVRTDEYAHAAGLVLLTPQGRIARYFYGIEFEPRDLRLGLVEAAGERIGSPVDQVLLLCYHYDPLTGKYGLVIMNVLRLAGAATVLALGAFMTIMIWRDRRRRPPAAARS
jgi:protein SCO1/2